jgi:RNA polymerase sigma factor (sigma-70 family)
LLWHRLLNVPNEPLRFRDLILADYADLAGAIDVVTYFNNPLMGFIQRRMAKCIPLDYRFTVGAHARETWRKFFPSADKDLWLAIDELDARYVIFDKLTRIADDLVYQGMNEIFLPIYDTYDPLVRSIVKTTLRRAGSTHDVDDATQNCWVYISQNLPLSDFITISELKIFIKTKAHDAAVDFIRREEKHRLVSLDMQVTTEVAFTMGDLLSDPRGERDLQRIELIEEFHRFTQRFGDQDFVLNIMEFRACDLTIEEVAAKLNVSVDRVRTACALARKEAVKRFPELQRLCRTPKTKKAGERANWGANPHAADGK